MNDRITKREQGLIKGALRRVFSRSELRRECLALAYIQHSDVKHPRVTKWVKCTVCTNPYPAYKAFVDHIEPVIPVNSAFSEMKIDDVLDRLWCELKNLQVICDPCHDKKTAIERAERKLNKRGKSDVKTKRTKKIAKKRSARHITRTYSKRTL